MVHIKKKTFKKKRFFLNCESRHFRFKKKELPYREYSEALRYMPVTLTYVVNVVLKPCYLLPSPKPICISSSGNHESTCFSSH